MSTHVTHARLGAEGTDRGTWGFREAAKKASLLTEPSTLDATKEPLKLPGFEQAVMIACTKALENWRDEALEGECTLEGPSQEAHPSGIVRSSHIRQARPVQMSEQGPDQTCRLSSHAAAAAQCR